MPGTSLSSAPHPLTLSSAFPETEPRRGEVIRDLYPSRVEPGDDPTRQACNRRDMTTYVRADPDVENPTGEQPVTIPETRAAMRLGFREREQERVCGWGHRRVAAVGWVSAKRVTQHRAPPSPTGPASIPMKYAPRKKRSACGGTEVVIASTARSIKGVFRKSCG